MCGGGGSVSNYLFITLEVEVNSHYRVTDLTYIL